MFHNFLDMFIFSSLTVKPQIQSAEIQLWAVPLRKTAAAKINQGSIFNLYVLLQQLW